VTVIVTLPVVSATPSMAESTASIEPAGGAEKAPTARPEAWQPRAYGGQGRAGHLRWCAGRAQGRVGECQHEALTATAHDGCGPNKDHAGHCGQAVVGTSASGQPHTRRVLTSWKPQREGRVRH